jgi:hypothetical protein
MVSFFWGPFARQEKPARAGLFTVGDVGLFQSSSGLLGDSGCAADIDLGFVPHAVEASCLQEGRRDLQPEIRRHRRPCCGRTAGRWLRHFAGSATLLAETMAYQLPARTRPAPQVPACRWARAAQGCAVCSPSALATLLTRTSLWSATVSHNQPLESMASSAHPFRQRSGST